MASEQREISVSEFFTKNRHLLGFDNPRKALLTTVKEAVDNSLDACEEAGVLPDVEVTIRPVEGNAERFRVIVEDNGPGIVKQQIPQIFAKLLYGSKFHRLRMSRGQQGIGISAAGMYGQLTTGQPVRITSRISSRKPAHYYEVVINTHKNEPDILKEEAVEWDKPRGTRVELVIEGKYQRGRLSVDDYLEQTAIANPHVEVLYEAPDGEKFKYPRAAKDLPTPPKEIKPHPYGVELGTLIKMLRGTSSRRVSGCLASDFSRVSPRVAAEICRGAGLDVTTSPKKVAVAEADRLLTAIRGTKIMAPSTDCLSPIGEDLIRKGLSRQIDAAFQCAVSRSPAVYRGNPFAIEAGIAFGGKLSPDGDKKPEQEATAPPKDKENEPEAVKLLRFANRVPLLYQPGACAITKAVVSIDWRSYGLQQPRGSLPLGPAVIFVHMASVWVPFTSESKEAVAHYPEILKEIKLALQECGRQLSMFINRRRRMAEEFKKRSYIEKYIPQLVIGLRDILGFSEADAKRCTKNLQAILEKTRGELDTSILGKKGAGTRNGE
ncbi:MAG: DNA topoisomerase VI subunit B [Planctomycetes bacterium]|nr:DNA topoisomerase VI subunit B [Planctomycetota bacterium]